MVAEIPVCEFSIGTTPNCAWFATTVLNTASTVRSGSAVNPATRPSCHCPAATGPSACAPWFPKNVIAAWCEYVPDGPAGNHQPA